MRADALERMAGHVGALKQAAVNFDREIGLEHRTAIQSMLRTLVCRRLGLAGIGRLGGRGGAAEERRDAVEISDREAERAQEREDFLNLLLLVEVAQNGEVAIANLLN